MATTRQLVRSTAWATAVAALIIAGAASASADTLFCPGTLGPAVTRQVSVSWDDATNPGGVGECEDWGIGNLGPAGFENVAVTYDGDTFPWIEKDDSGEANNGGILNIDIGEQSGAFSFTQPGDYLVGLKFGSGAPGVDPDWVIIQLTNINAGVFEWEGSATALSHALVWGTPGTTIPEPSIALMMSGGFAAAGVLVRRRSRKTRSTVV